MEGRGAGRATGRGEKWTKWTSMRNREKIRPSSCRSVKKQPEPGSVAQWIAHWTSSEQWKTAIQRLWVRVPPDSCAFKDDVQRGAKTFCCALPTTQKGFLFLHLIQCATPATHEAYRGGAPSLALRQC